MQSMQLRENVRGKSFREARLSLSYFLTMGEKARNERE